MNLSELQKKQAVNVKFQFDLSSVKQCLQQQTNHNYGIYYYTDTQPADDSRKIYRTMDDKNLFDWTARMKLEPYNPTSGSTPNQYLNLTVECEPGILVMNAKIFKMNCCQRSVSNSIFQEDSNAWTAKNVCSIAADSKIDFLMEADVYVKQSLESLMNMSESVAGIFENGRFTDLILSVDDQKFKCHKVMLLEKSPVFEAMVRIGGTCKTVVFRCLKSIHCRNKNWSIIQKQGVSHSISMRKTLLTMI
jgi:hypothetical protein